MRGNFDLHCVNPLPLELRCKTMLDLRGYISIPLLYDSQYIALRIKNTIGKLNEQ